MVINRSHEWPKENKKNMIITRAEQEQLHYDYFDKEEYTIERALVFTAGVEAMMDLVDKKLTSEREKQEETKC
tara:strand:- start:1188 stop:1406 length:219 start_codon:yes stop_codon:yes gene_type:complete